MKTHRRLPGGQVRHHPQEMFYFLKAAVGSPSYTSLLLLKFMSSGLAFRN